MDFGLTLRVFFVVDQMAVLLMHLHLLRKLPKTLYCLDVRSLLNLGTVVAFI